MDYGKLHIYMSRASRQRCGAVQVATRCFLLLLSLGLFLCVFDRRGRDGGRGIRIGKAPLGVWIGQARCLGRLLGCHGGGGIDMRAGAALHGAVGAVGGADGLQEIE